MIGKKTMIMVTLLFGIACDVQAMEKTSKTKPLSWKAMISSFRINPSNTWGNWLGLTSRQYEEKHEFMAEGSDGNTYTAEMTTNFEPGITYGMYNGKKQRLVNPRGGVEYAFKCTAVNPENQKLTPEESQQGCQLLQKRMEADKAKMDLDMMRSLAGYEEAKIEVVKEPHTQVGAISMTPVGKNEPVYMTGFALAQLYKRPELFKMLQRAKWEYEYATGRTKFYDAERKNEILINDPEYYRKKFMENKE